MKDTFLHSFFFGGGKNAIVIIFFNGFLIFIFILISLAKVRTRHRGPTRSRQHGWAEKVKSRGGVRGAEESTLNIIS